MGALEDLAALQPIKVWEGVIARSVEGERMNLAVVELEPSSVVPEHSHDNEQLGIVLHGSLSFRIGDEVRDLEAGGTYRIAPNVPHEVLRTGPAGRGRARRVRSRAGGLERPRASRPAAVALAVA